MNDVVALLAYLALPLIGIVVWKFEEVRALALDGRIAVAGVAGALITAIVMSALTLAHVSWSRTVLGGVLVGIAGVSFGGPRPTAPRVSWRSPAIVGIVIVVAITMYALLDARETIGDLLFFWGPKGIHFFRAGKIDVDFLRNPDHFLQHRDYPPMLPLLFAWSHTWTPRFSWIAALLLSALCLIGITAMIRTFARDNHAALLAASILAWCFARGWMGGGADPLLALFETLAVCALVFVREPRAQVTLAAIGIAGASVTKLEGASFAVAVLIALLLDRFPWRRIVAVLLPAIVLSGAWLTFIMRAQLLDTYRGPGELSFQFFGGVMRETFLQASYDAYWIPWIAPLLLVLFGDMRRARLPLMIATLSLGAVIFFYLKSPSDPTVFWIPSSAHRVLLTPLLMLLIAAGAASGELAAPLRAIFTGRSRTRSYP